MAKPFLNKVKMLLVIVAIIAGSWALQRWAYSEEIVQIDGKKVSVIDGDSFKVGDAEYRIYGIDAPEYRQACQDENGKDWRCGKSARMGLEKNLRGNSFSCDVRATDKFGRMIVICKNAKGIDLGSALVEQGYAASGHHFDESIYAVDEREAKAKKRGIWRGEFLRPDLWRAQNPRN